MKDVKCPVTWEPSCSCYPLADEPDDNCWIHGGPDGRRCPYCGRFKAANKPCRSCGYTETVS